MKPHHSSLAFAVVLALVVPLAPPVCAPAAAAPEGQVTFAATATRIEALVITGGIRSYGGYPDIDALFRDQAAEMDKKRREALLHKIQQLMYERAMFAPVVEQAALTGVGPRMAEVPTITGHPFVSPYEDLKLKGYGSAR